MQRFCSIPDIGNLRKWFEKNFHNSCAMHDAMYASASISRLEADVALAKYMHDAVQHKSVLSKAIVYLPTIAVTFIAVRLFGWLHYKR